MHEPTPPPGHSAGVHDLTGSTIGRFTVRARLGAGGMGEVYRADDPKLKRPVALKRVVPSLSADPGYRQRFLKEAERASALTHQHVAAVYDVLEDRGEIFLVMEFVEGTTLREAVTAPITEAQFFTIAIQCASALAAAHEKGIVHHDIKPENIMVTRSGEVKILDFGVARRLPQAEKGETTATSATATTGFSGTPAYMAPEVLLEKPSDGRADIFSLGVVLYEALAGKHPFRAESFMATCDRILREAPRPLSRYREDVSPAIEQVLMRLMEKQPENRYAGAAELLLELRRLQTGSGPGLAALVRPTRARFPRMGIAIVLAAAAVATLALVPGVRTKIQTWLSIQSLPRTRHLAVLPFTAVGGDARTQALCDGLVETLTARLTQFTSREALQVVPASEARSRGVTTIEQARTEFGVNLALAGSYHVAGNQVRVTYTLVDPATGRVLAGDTITAPVADPFQVEDSVVTGLLRMLDVTPGPDEQRRMASHGTLQAPAYDLYLEGRGYLQNFDRPENIESAIKAFQKALEIDPKFALAHTGLGEAYWRKYEEANATNWVPLAQQACEKAIALDPDLAAARICLGRLHIGRGQYEAGITEFERALRAEPTSDEACRGLAVAQERLGRIAEAEQTFQRAIDLRKHYWGGYNWLGAFYYRQGRYADAAAQFERVAQLVPESFQAHSNVGAAYYAQGRYPEAIAKFEESIAIRPTYFGLSNLGTVYFELRRFEDSAHTFERARQLDERDYVLWGNLGDAYQFIPGKASAATAAYQQAVTLAKEKHAVNPNDPYVLANLAAYYAMLGDAASANAWLGEALQRAPKDPDVLFKAALVHNKMGDADAAYSWLAKALAAGYSATSVKQSAFFDTLRSNQKFQDLFRAP